MSEKKYQVFVSSTFLDLKDERQAVSKAILNLGHIPAGMELFPAADIDQLSFIKKVIDDCDYYVLIIGGRYGSVSETGLSFTELEYQYAVEKGKPVLAFLHNNINELKYANVETDPDLKEKLLEFKEKVKSGRLVEFWSSVENLESKAVISLTRSFNEQPQTGWRRDNKELSAEAQIRLEKMRENVERIREVHQITLNKLSTLSIKLEGYESLTEATVEIRFSSKDDDSKSTQVTAEEIIREFAADLVDGLDMSRIEIGLLDYVHHKTDRDAMKVAKTSVQNVALFLEVYEICQRDGTLLTLLPDKKWLLKAAFKPLQKVVHAQSMADDIPF